MSDVERQELLDLLDVEMGRYATQARYVKEHPTPNAARDIKMESYWLGIVDGLNKVHRHLRGGEPLGSVSLPWETAK